MPESLLEPIFLIIDFTYLANILLKYLNESEIVK